MDARFAPGVLLIAIAIAAPSCDDDTDEPPAPPPPTTATPAPEGPSAERDGVVVSLDESPHPGETVQLTVENRTGTRLEYGVAYQLEHLVRGKWRWINRDAGFIAILKIAEPGKREREDIRLPEDLRAGRYRIVRSFSAPASDREIPISVEFTID